MGHDKGKMVELMSHPGFKNFSNLYIGVAYVGFHLEEYTIRGVKQIHASISGSFECASFCSLRFGRDLHKWCDICQYWLIRLTAYVHSYGVAWEKMKSWEWPDSYTNIIEVFVPTICSVDTPNLQDLYVQSFIWTNCNAFEINPITLLRLRDVRNAIVHNSTTCVADVQMEKCFDVLHTLLSDFDVNAYLNSIECTEFMNSIQRVQSSQNAGQRAIVLSNLFLTEKSKYKTNTEDNELHTSNYTRKDIYEEFRVHQKIIKNLTMHVLQQQNHKNFRYAGLLLKAGCCFMLMNTDITLIEKALTLIIFDIPVFPNVITSSNSWMPDRIISLGKQLVSRQLQRSSDQLSQSKTLIKECMHAETRKDAYVLSRPNSLMILDPRISKQLVPRRRRRLQQSKTLIEINKQAETRKDEWDRCSNTEDVALLIDLIHQGFLPDREQLDRTCAVFSRSSMIIDLVTDTICKAIKQKYAKRVQRVWAAYEPYRENHVVFVIITKENAANADIEFKPDYDLRFRKVDEFNSESREVILEENAQDLLPDISDIKKVQTCMKECTSVLMKNHSNLMLISASLLKCKEYGTVECTKERKPCIVLHVHIKGLIPLRESLFPEQLKGIDTDVREGCMLLHSGKGPHEKHPNVKMGCGIKANNQDVCGTLGGFIEHPEYGLCALTCAHAMIDDIKRLQNKRKKFENEHVECVQPCFEITNPGGSRFGILKLTVLQEEIAEGLVTLDYALIAVDKDRAPIDGSFPSAEVKELKDAGFVSPPLFETGEVIDFRTIAGRRTSIVKYGSTTLLTCGMIKWLNPTISFKDQTSGIMFQNQIQINLTKTQEKNIFSAGGDSGALIFKVDDNEKLTAVGLLVAGNEKIGFSVATPICEILSDIGVQRLKNFTDTIITENESPLKTCCRYYCKQIRKFFFRNRGNIIYIIGYTLS